MSVFAVTLTVNGLKPRVIIINWTASVLLGMTRLLLMNVQDEKHTPVKIINAGVFPFRFLIYRDFNCRGREITSSKIINERRMALMNYYEKYNILMEQMHDLEKRLGMYMWLDGNEKTDLHAQKLIQAIKAYRDEITGLLDISVLINKGER